MYLKITLYWINFIWHLAISDHHLLSHSLVRFKTNYASLIFPKLKLYLEMILETLCIGAATPWAMLVGRHIFQYGSGISVDMRILVLILLLGNNSYRINVDMFSNTTL